MTVLNNVVLISLFIIFLIFNFRSPPHPFITMLTNRPDYAGNLIQQANSILLKR